MSSTKRVRIAQEKPSCDTPSPSRAAKNALQSYISSLPNSLNTIATKLSSTFLAAYSEFIRRDRTVTRLQRDTSKLPHSARFNFNISGSKAIREDPKFAEIVARHETALAAYTEACHQCCLDTAKLELATAQSKACTLLIENIKTCADVYHIYLGANDANVPITNLLHAVLLHDHFLSHTGKSKEEMLENLKSTHPSDPISLVDGSETSSHVQNFHSLCVGLFLTPAETFLQTQQRIDTETAVAQHTKTLLANRFATTVRNAMDIEPTLDERTIKKLIDNAVTSKLRNLSKNSPGSDTPHQKPPSTTAPKQSRRKAAENNSGTDKSKSRNNSTKLTGKSNKKQTTSNNRKQHTRKG